MLKSKTEDDFRQRCSEVTIQSEAQGHFGKFVKMVEEANPKFRETFDTLDTDEERVYYCTMLNKMDHMVVKPVFKQKNLEIAKVKRAEGNEAYQKKRYKQAMMLYTMSAMKAPSSGDDTLAYSIANRSACLYYMGDLKRCMADIEFAMAHGYPDQLRYKLYERKAKCFVQMKQFDKAKSALTAAKKNLEANKSKFDEKTLNKGIKSLKDLLASISQKKGLDDEVIIVDEEQTPVVPKLSKGYNKKMQNLSNLVKVEHNEDVGRHVIAAKPIQAGDTLAVEEPFAAVLYPDKLGSNCDNCFAKLRAAVPCPNCAGVGYCSEACRDEACNSFHRYECQFQDLILGLGSSGLVRLAYRIVASQSLKFFNNIKHNLNVDEKRSEIESLALHYSIPGVSKATYLSYLNLFNLVGLDSLRWTEDLFNRAMMSVCLLKILKSTQYFPDKSDQDSFTSDEVFIGSLMMRHMNVLQFNAHEIYEFFRGDRDRMKPFKNNMIGVGVYPQASYFNHSCHPGTTRYNIGKKLVLKSLTPILPGQEVCENYGQVFYFKTKTERQKELSGRYWFECDCQACREDWPLLMENSKIVWKGDENMSALEDLDTIYDCGSDFMEHGQGKDAAESLTEYINEVSKLIDPPLETVIRAQDKLRTCFNDMGTVLFQDTALKINPQEKR
eukprot:GFUD01005799.1.p1 GENE.GFUD01005799.1~~GFUD01005799.1.p1  ORF type:complete len:667 (-),score=156.69 GFUD01005799.1:117-2117(-)